MSREVHVPFCERLKGRFLRPAHYFGEAHIDFLKKYGDFENGIPVHDTIARVVSCLSPKKFHECFINWMRDCHLYQLDAGLSFIRRRRCYCD